MSPGQQAHGPHVSAEAWQDLDGGKGGLLAILAGKLQMQQPIRRRNYIGEDLDVGSSAGSGIGHDIEAAQQRFPVGAHGHQAAAFSACSSGLRAIDCLGKVQAEFIDAFFQWNRVAKLSLSAGAVEIRILCAPDVLYGAFYSCAAIKPGIGVPQLACMIDEAASGACQDADLLTHGRAKLRFLGQGKVLIDSCGELLSAGQSAGRSRDQVREAQSGPATSLRPATGVRPVPRPASADGAAAGRLTRSSAAEPQVKLRDILSQGNGDVERMRCAFACIVLSQALAQAVGLNAHNGV